MKERFDVAKASPEAYQAMVALEKHLARCGLEKPLKELADLTLLIVAINAWNRIAIGFRAEPGTYQPQPPKAVLV